MPASSEGRPLPGEAEAALAVARALGAAAAAAHPLPLFDTRAAELKAVVAQNGTGAAASHARSSLSPATLAGAAAAARPVHGARAPEEVRAPVDLEEKRRARPEDVLGTSAPASATRGPAPLDLAVAVLPPPVVIPQAFEAILPQLVDDPSLRLALTGAQARLSVDTGDAGQLSLQLRVHDGVTEIRAAGPAAPMMDARQNELRVALAHEGLSLGQFDLTQSQSQQRHDRQEATEPERPPPPPRATSQGPQQSTTQGRVHVRA
jgi:hypothetical protein